MPSLTLNRPAGDVEPPVAAAGTADRRQADYFRRLLAESRRNIDHRLGGYQEAIAAAKVTGDAEGASSLRRMALIEGRERQTLDGLIENLDRRFPVPAPGGVSQGSRRARPADR